MLLEGLDLMRCGYTIYVPFCLVVPINHPRWLGQGCGTAGS